VKCSKFLRSILLKIDSTKKLKSLYRPYYSTKPIGYYISMTNFIMIFWFCIKHFKHFNYKKKCAHFRDFMCLTLLHNRGERYFLGPVDTVFIKTVPTLYAH